MPEVSDNAAILLATSYQAKRRAELCEGDLRFCNAIVVLIFACFYIEETIDVVIKELDRTKEMEKFTNNKPGMLGKFAWFYNNYFLKEPKSNYSNLYGGDKQLILDTIESVFPRFKDLYNFRNNISHGKINDLAKNFNDVRNLRQAAKNIVSILLRKVNRQQLRVVYFDSAIKNFINDYQECA